jgi:hypothetical protein
MANPVERFDDLSENLQKPHSIQVIFIDGFPPVASGGDVIERTCEFDSYGSCHAADYSQEEASFISHLTLFEGQVTSY